MKKAIWGAVILIVIVLLVVSNKKDNSDKGPIRIGFISPLSGDAASYGDPVKKGVEIAVDEINMKGGVDGRPFEVIYEDGKCNNKDATSAAQKLISIDKVKVIIGMICSGELLSAAPVAETAKVILIGQGSSPDITKAGDYIFRTFPSDSQVGVALVDHMLTKKFEKVAVVSGSSAYSIGLKNFFLDVAKEKNLDVVFSEDTLADTVDFRTILQKVKVTNPSALFVNPQTGQAAARMVEQARALGINSQFYGAYFTGPEFIKIGAAVEGTFIADAPSLDSSNPRIVSFKEATQKRYGSEPDYLFFGANAYDQVYLTAAMFKEVGTENTDKMKAWLYGVKDFDGISGKFGFDSNGDVTGISMRLVQVKNGEIVPAQ